MSNPRIISVNPQADYKLLLQFNNGETGLFDMRPYLNYPVYKRLCNPSFFIKAFIQNGIVLWDENLDLDPDTAYLESKIITLKD